MGMAQSMGMDTGMNDIIVDKVATLPFEDTVWVIGECEDPDDDDSENEDQIDDSARMLAIMDQRAAIIGMDLKDKADITYLDHSLNLLIQCMVMPMSGKPRRPKYLSFRNNVDLEGFDVRVSKYDIRLIEGNPPCPCTDKTILMKTCSICRKRGSPELFFKCAKCQTVYYCSEQCQTSDMQKPLEAHGHKVWCDKMVEYLSMTEELAKFPFTFANETTMPEFKYKQYKPFLEKHGVYSHGFWRRECHAHCGKQMPEFGALEEQQDPYVLPSEGCTLEGPSSCDIPEDLKGWESYYSWRGFSLDSPVAILLSYPLTMYHIVKNCLKKTYPKSQDLKMPIENFSIHLLGTEKEADMIPVFEELQYLLPNVKHLEITMIGPEMAKKVNGKVVKKDKMTFHLLTGMYHKLNLCKPDVAIGFNAGIGAYQSWGGTLIKLKKENIPAFFSDYCQYSCECAKSPMEGLKLGTISAIEINPFRSPVRMHCEEHEMPWYSNGFFFCLKYQDVA